MLVTLTTGPVPVVFADVEAARAFAAMPNAWASLVPEIAWTAQSPFILSSARTRAELESAQQSMGHQAPFICENGAAVYVPVGYFADEVPSTEIRGGFHIVRYGRSYQEVVDELASVSARLGIEVVGFRDLTVEDVALECRLTLLEASLAKMREYGEPFRIVSGGPDERMRLFRALRRRGLRCFRVGRFDYVDAPVDEATGMAFLSACYRRAFSSIVTVGLGDATRDARLLAQVQIPVTIQTERTALADCVGKPQHADARAHAWHGPYGPLLGRFRGRLFPSTRRTRTTGFGHALTGRR